jgi:hypothetical protein
MAVGSTTSASWAVSVRNGSLTTTKSRSCPRIDRIRCNSGSDTAGLVPAIQRNRIEPSSAYRNSCIACVGGPQLGICAGSRFQAFASSAIWAGFCQLRIPVRSPSAPVSRVFCAVGCPFSWKTLAPGLPIMPRSRLRLFTWMADAVA